MINFDYIANCLISQQILLGVSIEISSKYQDSIVTIELYSNMW